MCLALPACVHPNAHCAYYQHQMVQVPYCAKYGNGYCESTSYRSERQYTCGSWQCDIGYIAPDGQALHGCYRGERLQRELAKIEREAAALTRGGQANGQCRDPIISPDGHYVAFSSFADNLVPGDTNKKTDLFVKDLITGELTRASLGPAGEQLAVEHAHSALWVDSSKVVFSSDRLYVRDLKSGVVEITSRDAFVASDKAPDGSMYIDYEGSIKVRDGRTGAELAGVLPSGRLSELTFSANSQKLAGQTYRADGKPAVDAFVIDLRTRARVMLAVTPKGSPASDSCFAPSLSRDGQVAAYYCHADDIVPGDRNDTTDVFVRNFVTGTTLLVSTSASDAQGNDWSREASISADGNLVAFASKASNLVPGDTNGFSDIFVKNIKTGEIVRASVNPAMDHTKDLVGGVVVD